MKPKLCVFLFGVLAWTQVYAVPSVDPDKDHDGIVNEDDNAPLDPYSCLDADGDGCDDCSVLGSADANNDGPDYDGDGACDAGDQDDDDDGVMDKDDSEPRYALMCRDADDDGCDDCSLIVLDSKGQIVEGQADAWNDGVDTDNDGICNDGDADDDGDGVDDAQDISPTKPDACGDSDGDGCDDCSVWLVQSPDADGPDLDGDGLCDAGDPDIDGDGLPNENDDLWNQGRRCGDSDGDGCDDCALGPRDVTNDGVDTDGDGLCDRGDLDDDNDGILDYLENVLYLAPYHDRDGDGIINCQDADDRGDGQAAQCASEEGICTSYAAIYDVDGDGQPNHLDEDSDNDGIPDRIEGFSLSQIPPDSDGDGVPDFQDTDSDSDGWLDSQEAGSNPEHPTDSDQDGIPNYRQADGYDDDGDGFRDDVGAAGGVGCRANGAPEGLLLAVFFVALLVRRRVIA